MIEKEFIANNSSFQTDYEWYVGIHIRLNATFYRSPLHIERQMQEKCRNISR